MKAPTYKIFTELNNIKSEYENGRIEIVDGLYFQQSKIIKMCEFYSNSTYMNGVNDSLIGKNKDALGRDKPFYNIVNYRVTLAKTATDLDIKDINIQSDDPQHSTKAMFLNKEVYKWMKDSNFSYTLNKMGFTRPNYGGVLIKKCEDEEGELNIDVVEWKNVMTDQMSVMGGAIVERHFISPVDLKKKGNVWEGVDTVLEANRKINKTKTPRVTVYEIHGEFPVYIFNDANNKESSDSDMFEFSLQHYFIAVIGGKEYLLYSEEVDELPYMYLPWQEVSGRALGRGVIEESEEAQVWTNDAVINEKNAMDLAGKVVLKTNSKKLANNVLEVDNGKIFQLEDGKDINAISLTPSALGEFQNQINKWNSQATNATSSYDAITGEQPASGTPYSQTALLNQVASKPFDYRREEMGIFLSGVFEKWVLPHVIDGLYKEHVLRSDYSDAELELIDKDFAISTMNDIAHENIMNGGMPTMEDFHAGVSSIMDGLKKQNKTRYLQFPKGYFDDIDCYVTIITTGEQINKAAILQSLSTVMQTVVSSFNPNTGKFGVIEDPKLSAIFGRILEVSGSGITPAMLGIGAASKDTSAPPQAPAQAPTPSPMQVPNQLTPQ